MDNLLQCNQSRFRIEKEHIMNNYFGDIIKKIRKQRNLTQEQIAEAFGVSCQAISKWETGTSYPDISLLPIIADYFGVSVDYLLGHDTSKQKETIEQVCNHANTLLETNEHVRAISLLREMLVKHPGNEKLMYTLAWALSTTLRESSDNYEEAILLYLRLLESSTDTEMRAKVSRDLIYRYYTKGNYEKASYYVNSLPSFYLCREYNLGRSNLLEGKELSEYLQSNIQLFGNAMLECLEYFENESILTAEEKRPYTTELANDKITWLRRILA